MLLVRMRSKLVELLVSLHFQRVKTHELILLMMKGARRWWLFTLFIISTYLKSCILYFLFCFYSALPTKEIFFPFTSREYTFLNCKEIVSLGINTVMSISDGLGPSILCQKMEKARFMREEMDENVVYIPPEAAFLTLMLFFKKYFSLFIPWLGVYTIMFPARKRYKEEKLKYNFRKFQNFLEHCKSKLYSGILTILTKIHSLFYFRY